MNIDYTLFFDGCSKGNPGKAGAGSVLYKNNKEIWSKSYFVDMRETNNYAEYMGLIIGLQEAVKLGLTKLVVNGDSLLVIKQMQGVYKVNSPKLLPLYKQACTLASCVKNIEFQHVYRVNNKRADELANEALQHFLYTDEDLSAEQVNRHTLCDC